jgi:protein phosphatase
MGDTDPGPPPSDRDIDMYGMTHVGLRREQNEDHYIVCSLRRRLAVHMTSLTDLRGLPRQGDRLAALAAVADGAGGMQGGETASRTAVESLLGYVTSSMNCYYTSDPAAESAFLEQIRGAALRCHESVLAEGERTGQMMATTLTLLLFHWPQIYVVQVGDSRFYRLRDGTLEQITRDQTLEQDLIDDGQPEAASRFSNVLTSALGGPHAIPVVSGLTQHRSDVLLLCTDGLAGVVPDETIERRLVEMASAKQACRALVDDALAAGGPDNVTVVVGRVRPDRASPQNDSSNPT